MILRYYTLLLLILSLFAIWTPHAQAQSPAGELLAESLRTNVVRISAEGSEERGPWRQDGFGFVVGDRGNRVLIVTANHVVRRRRGGPDARTTMVRVAFFEDQGRTHSAELLGTHDEPNDLAVLEASLPAGTRWSRPVLATDAPVRGQPVWYVGRDRTWYVPTLPGRVNHMTLDSKIVVDGLNLQVGTSGAPLISDAGIVGFLTDDSPGASSTAVPIDIVRRAFGVWNLPWGLTPWDSSPAARLPDSSSQSSVLASRDLGTFSLRVDRITVGAGSNPPVTVFLTYSNKTPDEVLVGLCNAQNLLTTSLVDDLGDRYLLDGSLGISEVCSNRTPLPLVLPPRGSARASLAFSRHKTRTETSTSFSLTSEQALLLRDTSGQHRVKSRYKVAILELPAVNSLSADRSNPPSAAPFPPSPNTSRIDSRGQQPLQLPRIAADRDDFTFEADVCRRDRGAVTCSALVTNHAKTRKPINLCSSYVIDNLSNKYESHGGTRITFGQGSCGGDVEPELPVRFGITIPNLNPAATSLSIVFADGSSGSFKGSVILRNVTILSQ